MNARHGLAAALLAGAWLCCAHEAAAQPCRAQGTTDSQLFFPECWPQPPRLNFSVTGRCIVCGVVGGSQTSATEQAVGECQEGGTRCVPRLRTQDAFDATRREFFSESADLSGPLCVEGYRPRARIRCDCPTCPSTPGGPNTNTGTGDDPLLISLADDAITLSSAAAGVAFDLDVDGTAEKTAWTLAGADDAFLVLDRNGNGTIDNGLEVFGDITPQVPSSEPNGFRALAVFDDPLSGGNGDGILDAQDPIFVWLQLWTDSDHDGLSSPGELQPVAGRIAAFHLDYSRDTLVDEHGNDFRYRAAVVPASGSTGATLAWNVFFAH